MDYFKDHCDISLDTDFRKISGMKFLPWVGNQFSISKNRLLIVAESIYNGYDKTDKSPEELKLLEEKINDERYARWVIKEQGIHHTCNWTVNNIENGCPPNVRKVTDNFARAFYNKKNLSYSEKEILWSNTIFHELIQEPLNDINDRGKINYTSINKGYSVLYEVINLVKPKKILFIGNSNIEQINHHSFKVQRKEKIGNTYPREGEIKLANNVVPFIAIKHTSKYFSWYKWAEYLDKTCYNNVSYEKH